MKTANIKVKGHTGIWYIIATYQTTLGRVHLLEHEEYGDEAYWICVDDNYNLILDKIENGIQDVYDYIEDLEREVK